ncbi:hypothetical protein ACQKM9_20055 [Viridibacillus sp. NPDC093762]|uniref:hypothetical protein n=1 Tax=Viridibacillus sp. NPDC093762 TaxID=3390720 RepID=UPI003D022F25
MNYEEFKSELESGDLKNEYLMFKNENGKFNTLVLSGNAFYFATEKGYVLIPDYNAFQLLSFVKAGTFKLLQNGSLGKRFSLQGVA